MVDDFGTQVSGVSALAEPARRALYLYVVSQAEPVSRHQAAAGERNFLGEAGDGCPDDLPVWTVDACMRVAESWMGPVWSAVSRAPGRVI